MSLSDFLQPKGILTGSVVVEDLPPHRKLIVNLLVRRVHGERDAPSDNVHDYQSILIKGDESEEVWPLRFEVRRPAGFYYVGVGVIAFLDRGGEWFAQVERFFPMDRPRHTGPSDGEPIDLKVRWPEIPFETLGSYGTIHPRKSRG